MRNFMTIKGSTQKVDPKKVRLNAAGTNMQVATLTEGSRAIVYVNYKELNLSAQDKKILDGIFRKKTATQNREKKGYYKNEKAKRRSADFIMKAERLYRPLGLQA